jgi:hypothetical protein
MQVLASKVAQRDAFEARISCPVEPVRQAGRQDFGHTLSLAAAQDGLRHTTSVTGWELALHGMMLQTGCTEVSSHDVQSYKHLDLCIYHQGASDDPGARYISSRKHVTLPSYHKDQICDMKQDPV